MGNEGSHKNQTHVLPTPGSLDGVRTSEMAMRMISGWSF